MKLNFGQLVIGVALGYWVVPRIVPMIRKAGG